ncbi:hypothetical protein [Vibrio splendidus]|uniref:hypothetical protein n=1 Tax=Vibrio splendidus TaxID=29497 RepID=UPI000769EC5C|nr:hypothetical protein [Vibrio splendidus]PHX04452.1 hypothetical protein VSPL_39920 [Vibrio splendidus]
MKKSIILLGLTSLFASPAFAGGTFSGNPGDISKIEKSWNGTAGKQVYTLSGARIEWYADACGTMNGKVMDTAKCASDTPKGKAQ